MFLSEDFHIMTDKTDEKIDDFCAEFGTPRDCISQDKSTGAPNEFVVNGGSGIEIPVVILAEDEIHEYALYLAGQTLFDSFGFIEKAPAEADKVVNTDKMLPIIKKFYFNEAVRLSDQSDIAYPNKLADACVEEYFISDEDLDRYFNSDGEWLDDGAREDLCNVYAKSKAAQNIGHAVTWMNGNWDPSGTFWKDLGRGAAVDVKDILDRRGLIDIEKAAPVALEWHLKRGGLEGGKTELQFIAANTGELRGAGDYFAFCDDWDAVRALAYSSMDDEEDEE